MTNEGRRIELSLQFAHDRFALWEARRSMEDSTVSEMERLAFDTVFTFVTLIGHSTERCLGDMLTSSEIRAIKERMGQLLATEQTGFLERRVRAFLDQVAEAHESEAADDPSCPGVD